MGGLGFIGSNLVRRLVARGARVRLQSRRLGPHRAPGARGARRRGGRFGVKPFPAERKKIDIGGYCADDRRARRGLGWRRRPDIAAAVKRTVEFFRHELPHYL